MSTLARFQAALAGAIMRPLGPGETMRREGHAVAAEFVKPNARLAAKDRLQIYNQQYWWRLLGSFGDDFGGLAAVLGERRFERLAIAYLDACGSASWNLRDLGQGLSAFIVAHPELLGSHGPLARDMAALEWARVIAFDAAEWPRIDPVEFASRRPSRMKLGLQPYLTLLELQYPVDRLLQKLKQSENAAASNARSSGAGSRKLRLHAKPAASPVHLAIHRSELVVYYKRLQPAAYHLLSALRAGETLENACGMAFGDEAVAADQIAAKVQQWFSAWTAFGWLCEKPAIMTKKPAPLACPLC
ncbi:DNA-binding domain-containing protein [Haloferula sp. BvORR071]|uniref:HvfC/BufC N-terminal domain-containing protein n=1 Tax=Haloferula sp. BvORR071 TaxID=1396141 RepID=UPI000B05F685|nr:DNA-binding domain-containing protein [Haloferula sp. BvORR071]